MTLYQINTMRGLTVNIRVSMDELERLDSAWLEDGEHRTRTDYIRAAINRYAGTDILETDYTRHKIKKLKMLENLKKNESED